MPLKKYNRREFVKTSAVLLTAAMAGTSITGRKYLPLLSFSTLGCPDWPFEEIVRFAAANNYKGIEIRGIERELDLTKAKPFRTKQNIDTSLKLMQENHLKFVNLGSSAALHFPEGAERRKNIDDAKRFINLAQQLSCPYIRVFPNDFPKDQDKDLTKELIAKGLLELGNYANNTNVAVLLETHGQVVYAADLLDIMKASKHKHVGLIWDIYNMWSVTKESPVDVFALLKNYIHHTHIKDAKQVDGKEQYVLLGDGDSPILEAVDVLAQNNYTGYYSFEWEKLWHPEIESPEVALAAYPKAMQQHFAALHL